MSTPIAFHVMHSLRDRRVIFKTPAEYADAYRRALRIGRRFQLGWFRIGADHIHAVLFCSREEVARWANSIESSWTQAAGLGTGFATYHVKPVTDQGHLRALIRYIFNQEAHHGAHPDPDHLGSTGPDLCGGRLVGVDAANITRLHLPRLRRHDIESVLLGGGAMRTLADLGPAPAGLTGESLEGVLRSAMAAAVGRAALRTGTPNSRPLLRALLEVVERSPLSLTVELSRLLGRSPSTLRRLRARPVDPRTLAAVLWQVRFRLTRRALADRTR